MRKKSKVPATFHNLHFLVSLFISFTSSPELQRVVSMQIRYLRVYCKCLDFYYSKDSHIKKLLPLGFTRKAIRRELFLSNGDLNTAASKLLDQQQQREQEEERGKERDREGEGSLTSSEGWEKMVAAESSEEMIETQKEKKKSFSVGSIEVCEVVPNLCLSI